ncbi:MAG: YceI family protein [Planctomycetota bacterium]
MGHSHGMEARLSRGHLVPGANRNAGQLVIDMKSFDADTPLARQVVGIKGESANWMRKQVSKEMHGSKVLNSSTFPIATFDIASCTSVGVSREAGLPSYELAGNLTLCGQTKTITIPVTVEQSNDWLHLTGRFSFKQSDFGIKPLSKGFGAIGVADELTVFGDLWIAPTAESLASMRGLKQRR